MTKQKQQKLSKISNYAFLASALLSLLAILWMSLHVKFVTTRLTLGIIITLTILMLGWSGALFALFYEKRILHKYWRVVLSPLLVGVIAIYLIGNWASLLANAFVALPGFTSLTIVFLFLSLFGALLKAISITSQIVVEFRRPEIISKVEEHQAPIVLQGSGFATRFKRDWNMFFHNFSIGSWKYYLLFLTMIAISYFAVALVNNQFTVPLGGDYTQQTIPFYTNGYDDWWHFFKTGEFPLWDSSTNLGVNNIGANAFYYALNPFFLPILLVPRPFIAQGIALLMIGKLVLAAFTMKAYLRYMGVKPQTALLFAFAFAFCGWNTYYLWFNHFMEVTVVFPLVFLGIEKVLKEKRPWLLAGALALMGFTNYFFLVTTCIVGVIYAIFRFFQLIKTFRRWDFLFVPLFGVLAFAAGILMSASALLPGVMMSLQSDRVTEATYLQNLKEAFNTENWQLFFDYVFKWETQSTSYTYKKLYPLATFFFPVVSDRSSPIFATSSYDNTISSLFLYTPVMVMVVPSIIRSIRNRKFSHFVALVLLVLAIFTPFSYHALHGFTNEYGRWQIFVTLILITYTAINFDHREEMPIWYFDLSVFILILGAFLTYQAAFPYQSGPRFGELAEREYIVFYEFLALILVYLIYRFAKSSPHLRKYILFYTVFEAILMGNITMIGHGTVSFTNSVGGGISRVNEETEIIKNINGSDSSFFRMFSSSSYRGNDNIGMRENYNGLGAFHSLYNFKLMDFNSFSHVNYNHEGWSMGIQEKRYNLDTFLGVKYYIIDKGEGKITYVNSAGEITNEIIAPYDNVPLGYTLREELSSERYRVYENQHFIELGSSYTTLMAHNYYFDNGEEITPISRFFRNYAEEPIVNEEKYLNYAILDQKDLEEVLLDNPSLTSAEYTYAVSDQSRVLIGQMSETKYYCSSGFPYDDVSNIDAIDGCAVTTSSTLTKHKTGIIYRKKDNTNFTDEASHLAIKMRTTEYVRILLLDENDEIITFDDHNNINSSYKYMRGFYSPVPVKTIVIVANEDLNNLANTPSIYIQPETAMINQYQRLKANGFDNITHSYNHYYFQTNYPETRFAVTNIPYDEGWSAKIIDENQVVVAPKVYPTQGGFVGFVIPSGAVDVELNYFTPYLGTGLLVGGITFALWAGSFALVYFLYDRKKPKQKAPKSELEDEE